MYTKGGPIKFSYLFLIMDSKQEMTASPGPNSEF